MKMKLNNELLKKWIENSIDNVSVEIVPFKFCNFGLGPVTIKNVIKVYSDNTWEVFSRLSRVKEIEASVIGGKTWLSQCVMVVIN